MLSKQEAQRAVEVEWPDARAMQCVEYKGLYLVRVKWTSPDERDYDPFFSVDPESGVVNEFSIMTDADPVALAAAFRGG